MAATQASSPRHFVVGTFNTPELFTLRFDPQTLDLQLVHTSKAHGNHSWLALNHNRTNLYATCWTTPPSVAAYRIVEDASRGHSFELINTAETSARSGYVAVSHPPLPPVLYTVGGPTGEVMALDSETGGFDLSESVKAPSARLQELDFVKGRVSDMGKKLEAEKVYDGGNVMDFGGLRHGSHAVDLSPDGRICYVPDIGRNCVWVYAVSPETGLLTLSEKNVATRSNDGPRHTWPHPNGKYVYSLQEHSGMVDVFEVLDGRSEKPRLEWRQGVKVQPEHLDASIFWADEVRLSAPPAPGAPPAYLLASTRGLEPKTKGYVSAFALTPEGLIANPEAGALDMWQSPTSGGWANALEPAPVLLGEQREIFAALTDSEEGLVMMLRLRTEGCKAKIEEVARVALGHTEDGKLRQAATAVWLS